MPDSYFSPMPGDANPSRFLMACSANDAALGRHLGERDDNAFNLGGPCENRIDGW
jgi:hypothetical protein